MKVALGLSGKFYLLKLVCYYVLEEDKHSVMNQIL